MGACSTPPKKPKLIIEVSAKNETNEKALAEKLKEFLTAKSCQIDFDPILVNRELLYMKITYKRGGDSEMCLASGSSPLDENKLDNIAQEICNKVKEATDS